MNLIKNFDSEKMTNPTETQASEVAEPSYYYGQGFGISKEDVCRYQKEVAEGTNLDAFIKLAFCYYFGDNIPINIPKAIEHLTYAAEHGHPYAQYYLGILYFDTEGVEPDLDKAGYWFNKAYDYYEKEAAAGNPHAQYLLGGYYAWGFGREQDYVQSDKYYAEAIKYYKKAAAAGDALAQYRMGIILYNGQGVPEDFAQSENYFREAAKQGEWRAQRELAYSSCCSSVLEQNDLDEGMKLLTKVAELGDLKSQILLGKLYLTMESTPQNVEKALYWLEKAISFGATDCFYEVAATYERGIGIEQDLTKAVAYYQKAAAHEDENAQIALGDLYFTGKGVEKDLEKAFKLYQDANMWDSFYAKVRLARCYYLGLGTACDKTKAMELIHTIYKESPERSKKYIVELLGEEGYAREFPNNVEELKDYRNKRKALANNVVDMMKRDHPNANYDALAGYIRSL